MAKLKTTTENSKQNLKYLLDETIQIANMLAKSILTLKGK